MQASCGTGSSKLARDTALEDVVIFFSDSASQSFVTSFNLNPSGSVNKLVNYSGLTLDEIGTLAANETASAKNTRVDRANSSAATGFFEKDYVTPLTLTFKGQGRSTLTQVKWYVNSVLNTTDNSPLAMTSNFSLDVSSYAHGTALTIDAVATNGAGKDTTYRFSRTIVDSVNDSPAVSNVRFNPASIYTDTVFDILADTYDVNGDAVSLVKEYRVNSGAWKSLSSLNIADYAKGDTIDGKATPFDGTNYGTAGTTSTTVLDSTCTITVTGTQAKYSVGNFMDIRAVISDADSDNFTPTITGAVPGGTSTTTSNNDARISGTIAAGSGGNYNNTITAGVVGSGGCSQTINYNVNRPPVMPIIADITVNETELVQITPNATDPDGDPITYTFDPPIDPTGRWQTTYNDAGIYGGVGCPSGCLRVTVSDGLLSVVSQDITLTVLNVNRAPILNQIGNKVIDENSTLTFTITGSDPDADPVGFSASGLPSGATFNTATQTFTWTPNLTQAGTYNVTFRITDGLLDDTETITITVNNI